MDFATLKASVQGALGRTDVPDYIYTLMTADINRDIRILETETSTTLSVSGETTALPSDFSQVVSMYVDATPRAAMVPATHQALTLRHDSSGKPYYYAITDGSLAVMPVPDATYSVVLRYIAKVADFSAEDDTNDIIALHPGLFLYAALYHAAVWKQDAELVAGYGQAYTGLRNMVLKADKTKRNAGPMTQRPGVSL